jgi:hypothetical protein
MAAYDYPSKEPPMATQPASVPLAGVPGRTGLARRCGPRSATPDRAFHSGGASRSPVTLQDSCALP